ncbi:MULTISPECIES: NAD(P)-dependent alcohol dehydrogenase [unclassified Allomuricauda]|uniref:NAD(P)-dependent alcohol dehydrogenase n=1 Tax=unclassified Allomuricauda TaxID=2615049 RepID=UPI00273D1F4B|nr:MULTISPECIES: NAD(P)-dependent alcohol dehydrogenase [unclassified Allomuricauda]
MAPPEVLKLAKLEKPKPKPNEILIKVKCTSVCAGDVRLRSSDFPILYWLPARIVFGLFRPKKKTLGHEFSGIVEKVGKKVDAFKLGDEVFGTTTMLKEGSYAEYVCISQNWKHGVVAKKPLNLSHLESAALPIGAMTALFLLKKANISSKQNILVYGASGSVGTYAVQLASYYNAQVTGVCSGANIPMVKSLGAQYMIDYLKEDVALFPHKFDIIFDAVGKLKRSKVQKILKRSGCFVSVKMMTKETDKHLNQIKKMAERKEIISVIDRVYQFDEMVKAHNYVDQGHKRGNVVIQVSH